MKSDEASMAEFFEQGERFFRGGAACMFGGTIMLFSLGISIMEVLPSQFDDRTLQILSIAVGIAVILDGIATMCVAVDSVRHLREHRRLYGHYYR